MSYIKQAYPFDIQHEVSTLAVLPSPLPPSETQSTTYTQMKLKQGKDDQFFLLSKGEKQPYGPYTLSQVYEFVQTSRINSDDYIYCQSWETWKTLDEVFNLSRDVKTVLGDDGQDPYVLEETLKYMEQHAHKGEELYYIAVQHTPVVSITTTVKLAMPKSIILTNQRFCVLEPRLVSETIFEAYPVEYVESGIRHIKRGAKTGSFHIVSKSGSWSEVNKIPENQLQRLTEISHLILKEAEPRKAMPRKKRTLDTAA